MKNIILQKKQQIEFNTGRVCDLLQWTRGRYNELIFETAMRFLEAYFNDADAVKKMADTAAFWAWWQGMWDGRNDAFLFDSDGLEFNLNSDQLLKYYKMANSVAMLVSEIAPPRCIYPKGFTTIKMEMA